MRRRAFGDPALSGAFLLATREKIFNIPGVILALCAGLALLHGLREYVLSDEQDAWLLQRLAFTPARLSGFFDPAVVQSAFDGLSGDNARSALFLFGDGEAQIWTLFTYSLLHGDWVHYGVNALWLAAFGTPVARRFGTGRFLALFALCSIAGALAHYATHWVDFAPVVGASAAVAGAMAAACRFVFAPDAPLGDGFRMDKARGEAWLRPAISIRQVFTNSRTLPFIVVWMVMNFVFGIASEPLGISQSPIAWEAHIGGFAAGLFLFDLLDPIRRKSVTASSEIA